MNQWLSVREKNSQPDVSVCLINHDAKAYTLGCLRSVFENAHNVSLGVFVVENASNDGCAEAVRREFPQVHLLQNSEPHSFTFNNNLAIRQSTGRYVLVLNNDTLVQDGALDTLTRFMDQHPECGAATAKLLQPDGYAQSVFIKTPTLRSYAYRTLVSENLSAVSLAWRRRLSKTRDYRAVTEVEFICGACMFLRREVINQVGMFDEGYQFYFEDVDWSYRIRQSGWRMYVIPEAQITHFGDASLGKVRARAKIEGYKSARRFFWKHRIGGVIALPVLKVVGLINILLRLCMHSVLAASREENGKRNAIAYLRVLEWHAFPWRREKLMACLEAEAQTERDGPKTL